MLAVTRSITIGDVGLRQEAWQHVAGPELHGKTLGLVGRQLHNGRPVGGALIAA